jgi:hypothetical protein
VWFRYVATASGGVAVATCAPDGANGFYNTAVDVFGGGCPSGLVPLACNDDSCGNFSATTFQAVAGTQYWVRVSTNNASGPQISVFHLTINSGLTNDECAGAVPLSLGANGPFNSFGATTSPGAPACSALTQDLWYAFTAAESATLRVDTCGSNVDTVLAAYDACGGAQLACDDNDVGNLGPCAVAQSANSYLEFPVTSGSTYRIRVGNVNAATFGQYAINLSYRFSLGLAYVAQTSVASVVDVGGTPGNFVLNALTTNHGAYPNGYFYGVDVPIGELVLLALSGPPFVASLDGAGRYSYTVGGVPPLGVVLYGVAVESTPGGLYVRHSHPTSVAL